jgi:hypothetical protein
MVHAKAHERASSRLSHPDVITYTNKTNAGNKRSFSVAKIDESGAVRGDEIFHEGGGNESTYMVGVNI